MGYTKGEWSTTNSAFARWATYRGKITGARTFVTVGIELDQIAEVQGDTDEECEANAHLIASAPELYEALTKAQTYIARKEMYSGVQDRTGLEVEIIKALAKAEGK